MKVIKEGNHNLLKKPYPLEVKQTACKMWKLIRLLPSTIGTTVVHNRSSWNLYTEFAQLVEMLCGLEFNNNDLMLLQHKFDLFFPKFMGNFPYVSMKPKGLLFQHYRAIIRKFALLIKTLRFEFKIGILNERFSPTKIEKIFV